MSLPSATSSFLGDPVKVSFTSSSFRVTTRPFAFGTSTPTVSFPGIGATTRTGLLTCPLRERFGINPSRAYACGDEFRDYSAAIAAGMNPLVVSYGFENYERLVNNFDIPVETISRTPQELLARLCHTLDLQLPQGTVPQALEPN